MNCKEIYWIGLERYVPIRCPVFFAKWYKSRIDKGIKLHTLLRGSLRGKTKPYNFEFCKYLPNEFSANPIVIK